MPNANPLLDDLNDEHHRHLLEFGNLGKKRASPTQPGADWNRENSWTSLGYSAAISRLTCSHCGSKTELLVGVFHVEKTPSGAKRETALDLRRFQVTLGENYPTTIVDQTIAACPACLPARGFSRGD
jgi:hypothetical protein